MEEKRSPSEGRSEERAFRWDLESTFKLGAGWGGVGWGGGGNHPDVGKTPGTEGETAS